MLSLDFNRSNELAVREHVAYRYTALKAKLMALQGRLQDINAILHTRNPSLLLYIEKLMQAKQ